MGDQLSKNKPTLGCSDLIIRLIQHFSCSDHDLLRILSSYWLAHFYLMKKSAKVLLYFGLDCGILEFFTPAFLEQGSAERSRFEHMRTVIQTSIGGWIHFCMKRLRTLKSFQIFKSEIKKS